MAENDKETLKANYPSNSKTPPRVATQVEKPKEEKIIAGVAKKQKVSFGKRLSELFLEDDSKSVGQYVVHDVLIPAAKAMLSDMVGGGLDMLLFGERRRGSSSSIRRDGGRSIVNYNSMSNSSYGRDRDRVPVRQARAKRDYEEIVLANRGDAEDVLDRMIDVLSEYNMVSVGDLYEMVGIDSNFTDQKYGWTDLRTATVNRVRDGYLINLPRPQPLD